MTDHEKGNCFILFHTLTWYQNVVPDTLVRAHRQHRRSLVAKIGSLKNDAQIQLSNIDMLLVVSWRVFLSLDQDLQTIY